MIDKDIFPLMTWKIKNKTIDNQIEGLVNGDEYKIITPSEIDYTRLGDSVFSRRGPSNCFIIIPLKDGSLFTIQDPDPLSTIALSTKDNNPSQYAKKDDEEFFSEMMVAIANNEYTGEPTKTRFKALVDKYIPFFGKSVKDNQALLPI
jgi:hypothetical protein